MIRTVTRLAVVALILGVIGGLAAAIAIPRTVAQPASPPREPIRVAAPARQSSAMSSVVVRRTGAVSIEARTVDPDGGPDWAVRSFLAERLTERAGRLRVIGRPRCVQLGRVHRGAFGWIDHRGTFRPASIGYDGAPLKCGSRQPDLRREPFFSAFRRLSTPRDGGAPRLGRTVVWGIAGSAARAVDVRAADGRSLGGASGPRNVILHVVGENTVSSTTTMTTTYASGKRVIRGGSRYWLLRTNAGQRLANGPDPGSRPFVAARTADPNGGLPYGILGVRARGRGWCVNQQPGRIVEEQVGQVDFALGTFSEALITGFECQDSGLSRKRPAGGGWGSTDQAAEPGADPGYGRIARRTLPGVSFFAGSTLADVRSLTLKSPRDVRTIVPSSPAHAYLVVYDGTFSTGEMRMTSTFAGGRTTTSIHRLGP